MAPGVQASKWPSAYFNLTTGICNITRQTVANITRRNELEINIENYMHADIQRC